MAILDGPGSFMAAIGGPPGPIVIAAIGPPLSSSVLTQGDHSSTFIMYRPCARMRSITALTYGKIIIIIMQYIANDILQNIVQNYYASSLLLSKLR